MFNFSIPIILDKFSLFFSFTVNLVAFCVFMFSKSYMNSEKNFKRFHLLVYLFVFSMYLLIFSPSLVSLFLGWDGLGISSYFLVVYFDASKSFNAGLLTAFTNRLGDALFLLSMVFFLDFSSWNFFLWSQDIIIWNSKFLMMIILVACCTKSAQIPFSAWLPAAMAAPTPVSALVHSSTLVTAGVYILIRFSPLFFYSNNYFEMKFLFFLGSITMLMAGMSALQESDAKKIVALSTLSQLGIMMMSIGVKSLNAAFFHLLSHAYFKALLFMVVGNLIHLSASYQDLRKLSLSSILSKKMIIIGTLSNFSLMGLPFLSGFYSKDYCIESSVMINNSVISEIVFFIGIILTIFYSIRFTELAFNSINYKILNFVKEKELLIFKPMLYLAPFAVFGSSMLSWFLLMGLNNFFIVNEMKMLILVLILASFFKKKMSIFFIKNSFLISSNFFMWNMGWISSYVINLTFLNMGKSNFLSMESKWTNKSFWQLSDKYFLMNSLTNTLSYKMFLNFMFISFSIFLVINL